MAGHIPPAAVLATHGVYMNTCAMLYMVPLGVASATATIGGNLLGAGDAASAWGVIKMGVACDFLYGALAGLLLYQLRDVWGALYTSDPEVQALVAQSMAMLALYEVVDSTKCVTLNVLRSIGLPEVTVAVNCVCCVFILLPVGWLLGVRLGFGLSGLWSAMSLAWLTATLIFSAVVLRTDWQEQVEVVRRRNESAGRAVQSLVRGAAGGKGGDDTAGVELGAVPLAEAVAAIAAAVSAETGEFFA